MRDGIKEMQAPEFMIRKAGAADVDAVWNLMEQVKAGMDHPEWYVTDTRSWVETHMEEAGFTLVAETESGELAGFFIVDFPAKRPGCGYEKEVAELGLGLCEEELKQVAYMDSAAVSPAYRGHHLQSRLLLEAERELKNRSENHCFCTVHPDNYASLHTMQRHGYQILATKEKYGGLIRHVLYKKKEILPRILVSACLMGVNCRYNGKGELCKALTARMDEIQMIPVCPEILGGLSTPRDPAERCQGRVVTNQGADVTAQYAKGAEETLKLAKLYGCRYAVLKERSPSCGRGKIYDGTHSGRLTDGDGMTAELLEKNGIRVFGESTAEEWIRKLF